MRVRYVHWMVKEGLGREEEREGRDGEEGRRGREGERDGGRKEE